MKYNLTINFISCCIGSPFGFNLQRVRKVAVHLGYGTQIWLSVSKLPSKCAVVSLYPVVITG
jgi:hypothetical protein